MVDYRAIPFIPLEMSMSGPKVHMEEHWELKRTESI